MGRADKRGLSEQCGQYQRALAMERRLLSSFYTLKRRKALKPDSKIENFFILYGLPKNSFVFMLFVQILT